MVKIVINSITELKTFQQKIKILKNTLPTLQKQAIQKTADTDVLKKIKQKMKQENFSKKIIDATFVGKTEQIGTLLRTHIISNYTADNGFDVSKAREEGTSDHLVLPKKKDGELKWIGGGGKPFFRKFSRPKGIQRLLIIENTIKREQNNILRNYQNNMATFVSKFLGP